MSRTDFAIGAGRRRDCTCGLGAVFLTCFPAALLLVALSVASHHATTQPGPSIHGLPGLAPDALASGSSHSGALPLQQQQAHRSMRQQQPSDELQNVAAMQQQQQEAAIDATSAQQLAAQRAGTAIELLSERIAAAPLAAVGSLGGSPQDPLHGIQNGSAQLPERQPRSGVALSGNGTDGAGGSMAVGSGAKPKLFLFIGILSGRGYRHRRLAVRDAWARQAQVPGVSVARFIMSADEHTTHVQSEMDESGDIAFVAETTTYKSILFKTYFLFEYAVTTYDVAFILKTDDDSFVNPPWLVIALRKQCVSEGCRRERLYMGRMATASPVLLRPGHRWANADFWNHTGLRTYPKYAMGGGYVLSGDAASMLVDMQARVGLKFSPIEDAMMGTWLMPLDLRHISHRRFWTWANPCCFKPVQRTDTGAAASPRFEFAAKVPNWICSDNPWLVLHKVDSPAKMRFLGEEFAKCSAPPAGAGTDGAAAIA